MLTDARATARDGASSWATHLGPILSGAAIGLVVISLGALETRWMVFVLLAIVVGVVVLSVPDKRRLLVASFILSFQADVCFRLLYGKADTAGLEFQLIFVTGSVLWMWLYATGATQRLQPIRFAASLNGPILALFATSILSLATTSERFAVVTRLLFKAQLWFVYFLALNVFRSRGDVRGVVTLLFVALGMQTLIYYIQSGLGVTFTLTGDLISEGDIPRPGGTVSTNPAGFASFIIPVLFLALAAFFTRDPSRDRRVLGLLSAGGIAALILTFTRASWSAFVIGMTLLLILSFRRGLLRTRDLVICVCTCLVLVAVFSPMITKRLAASPLGDAYDERAGLMRIAVRVIKANPVTGVGDGAYRTSYQGFVTGEDKQWLATVHNEYLLVGAETGIPGLVAFVWLLLAAIRRAHRLSRSRDRTIATLGLGWTCGIVALCWEMYWDIWRGFTYNAMLWFMLGLIEATLVIERQHGESSPQPKLPA